MFQDPVRLEEEDAADRYAVLPGRIAIECLGLGLTHFAHQSDDESIDYWIDIKRGTYCGDLSGQKSDGCLVI